MQGADKAMNDGGMGTSFMAQASGKKALGGNFGERLSNIAGPVTGTIFGGLGAEVIKIEKLNGGDGARR